MSQVTTCSCGQAATHYRRYDLPMPEQGVVIESYQPTCDECVSRSVSLSSAPRIPLSEVVA